jgi:hypothetical protein
VESLRAEPGLKLVAAPEGQLVRPPRPRRLGFFSPTLVIPIPRDVTADGAESFLVEERELRALGVFGRAPIAWAVAVARPFRRAFERELGHLGATWRRHGLEYVVSTGEGGEAARDLGQAIQQVVLRGADYLASARALAREATDEARQLRGYLARARELLGPAAALRYRAEQGVLEVGLEGGQAPSRVALRGLMAKTSIQDGSFDRYLKMAISKADLGVGLDVCGCGARAFVSKKIKPRDWPSGGDASHAALARRVHGSVSFIYTRDCHEHSHYLSMHELERLGLGMDDLERRFEQDVAENSYHVAFRAIRVDAHVFFAAAGFNAASVVLSPALVRGLLDVARVDAEAPAFRFLATTTGSFVLGDPEAPAAAFREAARVAEGMLRELEEPHEPIRHEGVVTVARKGAGEFGISS